MFTLVFKVHKIGKMTAMGWAVDLLRKSWDVDVSIVALTDRNGVFMVYSAGIHVIRCDLPLTIRPSLISGRSH